MQHYWWKDARIYELYIDKFAGTLAGLTEKLPYLEELGINTLHLLPHFPSPMVDGGYDVSDYRGVRPELGTLEDFAALLAAAHARGLRIIIDFVLNHTSREHPWFVEAAASRDSATRAWYLWRDEPEGFAGALNAFPDLKESNWIYSEKTKSYYFATFYPEQPDLNWDNDEVFEAMWANMAFWAELGVDGFRLDAAPYLIKRENSTSKGLPETHATIKRLRARLEARYPEAVLLCEAHQSVALTKQYFGQGDECHLAYHFPLMEQLLRACVLGEAQELREMVEASFSIPENCQWVTFLRNHDEISLATLEPEERDRLIGVLDPEHRFYFRKLRTSSLRLAEALGGDHARIAEALALLYSLPGAPDMYYGDEIGMRNLPPTEGIIDTRIYVRGAFDWQEALRQRDDPASLLSRTKAIIRAHRSAGSSTLAQV